MTGRRSCFRASVGWRKPAGPGRPGRFLLNQALAFFPLTVPLLPAAAVLLVRTARREEQFLRACVLPIVLVFAGVSFFRPAHLLWPLPGYLAMVVVLAGVLSAGSGRVARLYERGRTVVVGIAVAGFLIGGVHLGFFLPWISPIQGPYGWEETAARAREVRQSLPDSAFYLALGRKYTCTSQLAYRLNQPYTVFGADLIGDNALQYDYWSDPASLKGRSAVIVLENQTRADRLERLRPLFETVEPAGEVIVPVGRSPILPTAPIGFSLYRASGYRPPEALLSGRLDRRQDRRRNRFVAEGAEVDLVAAEELSRADRSPRVEGLLGVGEAALPLGRRGADRFAQLVRVDHISRPGSVVSNRTSDLPFVARRTRSMVSLQVSRNIGPRMPESQSLPP